MIDHPKTNENSAGFVKTAHLALCLWPPAKPPGSPVKSDSLLDPVHFAKEKNKGPSSTVTELQT